MDKIGAGAGFLRELRFPLHNLHSICFSTIIFTITRGWHNTPGVAAVPIASQSRIKKKKTAWLRFPTGQVLSLLYTVQIGSRVRTSCHPIVTWFFFPSGVKRKEREADHSSQFSTEVKKDGAIPPLSYTSSFIVLNQINTRRTCRYLRKMLLPYSKME
jgi:hypothetical protein